jgi:homoserine kinase type II
MNRPTWDADCNHVLRQYPQPCRPETIVCLAGAGGFSGAYFWRLTTALGQLCLRRWPKEHPHREKLEFTHRVLEHVHRAGFRAVPLPLRTVAGATYVEHEGQFWELSPWMSGEANFFCEPTQEKLVSAAQSLARFHVAASTFPRGARAAATSPGLERRLAQLVRLQQGGARRIRQLLDEPAWPGLRDRAGQVLDCFDMYVDVTASVLRRGCRLMVPLQPCIRDIWHDHVLYTGNSVSGFVDFGAMDCDTVAGDIARLFGSLAADDDAQWQTAMTAYESQRPLSADERALVSVFDQSTALLSGMNWLTWIYVDRRDFAAQEAVVGRLDVTIERLRHLSEKVW